MGKRPGIPLLCGERSAFLHGNHGSRSAGGAARASADSLLLLDLNPENADVQVPGKLLEYIQIGRPILAFTTKSSPAERILRKSEIPHVAVCPSDSSEEVDRKVWAFLQLPNRAAKASECFWREFAAPGQAKALAKILDDVLQRSVPAPAEPP